MFKSKIEANSGKFEFNYQCLLFMLLFFPISSKNSNDRRNKNHGIFSNYIQCAYDSNYMCRYIKMLVPFSISTGFLCIECFWFGLHTSIRTKLSICLRAHSVYIELHNCKNAAEWITKKCIWMRETLKNYIHVECRGSLEVDDSAMWLNKHFYFRL